MLNRIGLGVGHLQLFLPKGHYIDQLFLSARDLQSNCAQVSMQIIAVHKYSIGY